MNNQSETQENVKKAMAKQTLGLPLTPREHALIVLYGQSPVSEREDKPAFVITYSVSFSFWQTSLKSKSYFSLNGQVCNPSLSLRGIMWKCK